MIYTLFATLLLLVCRRFFDWQLPDSVRYAAAGYEWLCAGCGLYTALCWLRRTFWSRPLTGFQEETLHVVDGKTLAQQPLAHGFKTRLLCALPKNQALEFGVQQRTLEIESLPAALDGLTIAHFSDLHYTGMINQAFFHAAVDQVKRIAFGVSLWVTSAETPESLAPLKASLRSGSTVALLGPSGAGKSTLVNALAGSARALTGDVRDHDRKGRHTTTTRELFRIHNGALLMDTPGMRELRVLALGDGLDHTFPDIRRLADECRFRDCTHDTEPDCAVREAVAGGTLGSDRLASFRKLEAEAAYERRRDDPRARAEHVAEHKSALKTLKHHTKRQERG